MSALDQKILEAIKTTPGQKAKDIAAALGIEGDQVNSALYGSLRGKVWQDKNYRWYPKDGAGAEKREREGPRPLNTPLARLCRYYLDCLNQDDLGGVSVFASSKYGSPTYVELTTLPRFDDNGAGPFDSADGRRILDSVRRDRSRQTIILGYPVRLKLIGSRKGWEGFMVQPLLLFPFQEPDHKSGIPTLIDDPPQINFQALKALTNSGDSSLIEEAIQLAEELGLGNTGDDRPNLEELIAR